MAYRGQFAKLLRCFIGLIHPAVVITGDTCEWMQAQLCNNGRTLSHAHVNGAWSYLSCVRYVCAKIAGNTSACDVSVLHAPCNPAPSTPTSPSTTPPLRPKNMRTPSGLCATGGKPTAFLLYFLPQLLKMVSTSWCKIFRLRIFPLIVLVQRASKPSSSSQDARMEFFRVNPECSKLRSWGLKRKEDTIARRSCRAPTREAKRGLPLPGGLQRLRLPSKAA